MFTIRNQISAKSFKIKKNEPILSAALNAGCNFPYGCQKGFCGKCKALIISGETAYKGDIPDAISAEEVAEGRALLCQSYAQSDVVLAVVELDSLADIEQKTLPCKVAKINHLNDDVVQIFLKIAGGKSLQYLAGQYLDLIHPDFPPRAFSIANAAQNSSLIELHVRLVEGGKFTYFVFNQLKEQSLLKIQAPKGDFYLRHNSDKPIILVAGGTGFAPIKAVVEHAIITHLKRQMIIYWGVRDEADLYMDLPLKWAKAHNNIDFIPVLSEPNTHWKGRVGFVHDAVLADFKDLANYEVYACGPPIMIESVINTFTLHGMIKRNFFSDAFEFSNIG